MPVTNTRTAWSGGKLQWTDASGTAFREDDGANLRTRILAGGSHSIADGGSLQLDPTAGGSTITLTRAAHDGKTILLDTAAGTTVTLPAATGSGARFRFIVKVVATSNAHVIKVANASDTMVGQILAVSDDAGNTVKPFFAATTDDTITLNRSTTGSTRKGEWIEVVDLAANLWAVSGVTAATGTEATPFSATVS